MYSESYIGIIGIFAGNFAPVNWLPCDGRSLPIDQYDVLFAIIGTTFGGDGIQTFNLPDLRGRAAIHQGQGSGLSPYVIGQLGGTENVTLVANNLPQHTHALISLTGSPGANSGVGTTDTPTNAVPAQISGTAFYNTAATGTTLGTSIVNTTTTPVGQSIPVDIISPVLAINYVICIYGIFPSQN